MFICSSPLITYGHVKIPLETLAQRVVYIDPMYLLHYGSLIHKVNEDFQKLPCNLNLTILMLEAPIWRQTCELQSPNVFDRSLGVANGTHWAWGVEMPIYSIPLLDRSPKHQDRVAVWLYLHVFTVRLFNLAMENNCNIKKTQWQINVVYCFKTKCSIPTNVTKSGYQGYQNSFPVQLRLYPIPEIRHPKLVN